jgi:capreomycidine synthase
MEVAPALLEHWLREYYFTTEIDISCSGVQNFSMAELRKFINLSEEDLDRIVFDDSPTCGNERLRKAIAARWGTGNHEGVMAAHGSSEIIFLILNGLLEAGDEVLVLDPCYFSFRNLIESKGCRVKSWPLRYERKFEPDMEEFKKLITPRTRMVIVNFPHNPTGASITAEQQRELIESTASVGAYLVWDAAFNELTYDSPPLPSPLSLYSQSISIGTVSKAYGLAGLRVGWCIAPPSLIERFVHLRDYTTLYLSPLVELIAERAIKSADLILKHRLQQARTNLEILTAWMQQHEEVVDWARPRGGVTAFIRFRHLANVENFCRQLARRRGVLLVPGSCFNFPNHARIGFGGQTDAFKEALSRLSSFIAEQEWQPDQSELTEQAQANG